MPTVLKRILYSLLCLLPFAVLFVLSETVFKDAYLFKRLRDPLIVLLIAAVWLTALIKLKAGAAFSLSCMASAVAAQLIGNAVQRHKAAGITAEMSEGEVSRLMSNNPTVTIWLVILAAMLLACAAFAAFRLRKGARQRDLRGKFDENS